MARATRTARARSRPVVLTSHAYRRLTGARQDGITLDDVLAAACSIPGYIRYPTRFRRFLSASGRCFDVVMRDLNHKRIIITIIGREED